MVPDIIDNCPDDPNPIQQDLDDDGLGNRCDNCPFVPNQAQNDADFDGIGDGCDTCPFDAERIACMAAIYPR
jgi:hypothetical protein